METLRGQSGITGGSQAEVLNSQLSILFLRPYSLISGMFFVCFFFSNNKLFYEIFALNLFWFTFICKQKRPPNGRDKNVCRILEGFCEAFPGEETPLEASQGAFFKSRTPEVLWRHFRDDGHSYNSLIMLRFID